MKKAQIKMMETIAILIVFFILLTVVGIFYATFQKESIRKTVSQVVDKETVQLALKLSSLPELRCSKNNIQEDNCIDSYKLSALKEIVDENKEYYNLIFGKSYISLEEVYPGNATYELYGTYDGSQSKSLIPIPLVVKHADYDRKEKYSFGVLNVAKIS